MTKFLNHYLLKEDKLMLHNFANSSVDRFEKVCNSMTFLRFEILGEYKSVISSTT